MPLLKPSRMFPCAAFFAEGRSIAGVVALLMQFTVVLWPVASRWAERAGERSGVERLLAELSEAHRLPHDPYAMPSKKFRQLA